MYTNFIFMKSNHLHDYICIENYICCIVFWWVPHKNKTGFVDQSFNGLVKVQEMPRSKIISLKNLYYYRTVLALLFYKLWDRSVMKVGDSLHNIIVWGIWSQSTVWFFYAIVETIRILIVGNGANSRYLISNISWPIKLWISPET